MFVRLHIRLYVLAIGQYFTHRAKNGNNHTLKQNRKYSFKLSFEADLLSSEKNRILSLKYKIDVLRLEEWRDVLYPWVIYFDSPLTHRVHNMSKLILGTRGIHHSSSSEVVCMMRHVACHWISFWKPLPDIKAMCVDHQISRYFSPLYLRSAVYHVWNPNNWIQK